MDYLELCSRDKLSSNARDALYDTDGSQTLMRFALERMNTEKTV